jgi:hypothetical protein
VPKSAAVRLADALSNGPLLLGNTPAEVLATVVLELVHIP